VKLLTWSFWLWSAALAFGGGVVGASLNCGEGDICRDGSPGWLEPWTWGDYSVYPEVSYVSAAGFAAASAFLVLTTRRRRMPATIAFFVSLVLLSYPYFAGLTESGRGLFVFGPLLGAGAVVAMHRRGNTGADARG
jgi:hypothetical protein